MPAKVIARLFGGLGNQLFCYAAARRLALVNGVELVVDDVSGFTRDHAYQRGYALEHFSIPCRKAIPAERLEPFSRARRYLRRVLNRRRPFEERTYIQQERIDFDSRLLDTKPRGTLYLEGYWQSENYFKDVEPTIRSDLRMKPPTDPTNLETAARIRDCTAVAVHARFFNAVDAPNGNNAPRDYYARAMAQMEALVPNAHYFLFSDQPHIAHAQISPYLPKSRITYISHNRADSNAYADLWLMTQCRHFIIANSTFSWWGAWLAQHPYKRIIAPGFEMRVGKMFWGFDGLLPKEWITLA